MSYGAEWLLTAAKALVLLFAVLALIYAVGSAATPEPALDPLRVCRDHGGSSSFVLDEGRPVAVVCHDGYRQAER